jgi:hypothetical protein
VTSTEEASATMERLLAGMHAPRFAIVHSLAQAGAAAMGPETWTRMPEQHRAFLRQVAAVHGMDGLDRDYDNWMQAIQFGFVNLLPQPLNTDARACDLARLVYLVRASPVGAASRDGPGPILVPADGQQQADGLPHRGGDTVEVVAVARVEFLAGPAVGDLQHPHQPWLPQHLHLQQVGVDGRDERLRRLQPVGTDVHRHRAAQVRSAADRELRRPKMEQQHTLTLVGEAQHHPVQVTRSRVQALVILGAQRGDDDLAIRITHRRRRTPQLQHRPSALPRQTELPLPAQHYVRFSF